MIKIAFIDQNVSKNSCYIFEKKRLKNFCLSFCLVAYCAWNYVRYRIFRVDVIIVESSL